MEMQSSIDTMLSAGDIAGQGEHREVLETYRMFAQDHGWRNRMMEAIHTGLTAEAAVQKVQNDTRARMREVTDPYLRERLADLDDLANRLLRHLLGADMPTLRRLPDEAILVARTMGPAELLDYDRAAAEGPGAGGRLAERPRRDRRARARHPGARPLPGSDAAGRRRRSAGDRRRQRHLVHPAVRRHPGRPSSKACASAW